MWLYSVMLDNKLSLILNNYFFAVFKQFYWDISHIACNSLVWSIHWMTFSIFRVAYPPPQSVIKHFIIPGRNLGPTGTHSHWPSAPSWQPLIYSVSYPLSLSEHFTQMESYNTFFYNWILSVSRRSSKFIHVVIFIGTPIVFIVE